MVISHLLEMKYRAEVRIIKNQLTDDISVKKLSLVNKELEI